VQSVARVKGWHNNDKEKDERNLAKLRLIKSPSFFRLATKILERTNEASTHYKAITTIGRMTAADGIIHHPLS
jgi:hypothetical protein